MPTHIPFSVIFLSGGLGLRIGGTTPKQYLPLNQKPLALHSFELFLSLDEVQDIVIVCHEDYEGLFLESAKASRATIRFAKPGSRRQDSVFNALQQIENDPLVCIHDAARPFIQSEHVRAVVQEAEKWDAAVLGTRLKSTIKVCDPEQMILNTPCRDSLWEAQTPQVIRCSILKEGFTYANERELTVTDDVSLVELIGKPVKVVEGSYNNIKITTPEDLSLVSNLSSCKDYAAL
jgi:2-C-methyl-D-erythritol 4-phosphate cytidylyltransferase